MADSTMDEIVRDSIGAGAIGATMANTRRLNSVSKGKALANE